MNVRSCLIAPMLALLISLTVSATEISLCYEEWRPYAYKTSDGRFNGSVIERLKSAAKKHNVRLVFHELPHSRCILSVKGLKIDFALFVDETEHMPMLNNAVATWDLAIITRPGEMPTEQEKLTAHHIKQIIIARDYDYPKEVLNYFSSINKKVLEASYYIGNEKDVIRIFNLLLQKKGDAMVVDKQWTLEVKTLFNIQVEVSDWTMHSEPQFLGYYKLPDEKIVLMQSLIDER